MYHLVYEALEHELPEEYTSLGGVVGWNDASGRTAAEVIEHARQRAKELRNGELTIKWDSVVEP